MHLKISFILVLAVCASLQAQQIPTPAEFLGYEPGDKFTLHHKVVRYFQAVAEASPAVRLHEYGETYEGRPLMVAYISSPANLARLDEIRENNLQLTGLESGDGTTDNPAIVWLSYNVHGNESSSTEAAIKTLHYLTNPENEEAARWLDQVVVIMDPCINPDGRDRYVNYYKQYGQVPASTNPYSMSHQEDWPGGRVNHYLFDLNRDWFWLSQQESQQRLSLYNQWMPQIHVDFHEQSPNSPYYFAPGAEPYHAIITDWQRQFQRVIGENHASYFDRENWAYFTSEVFDLLYPSYGDTYPMFNGAIGMTYEQAGGGGAGRAVTTEYGDTLFLSDRINHHFTTGISTIEVAAREKEQLLQEFRNYFDQPATGEYKAFIIPQEEQQDKVNRLLKLMDRHRIRYGTASSGKRLNVFNYGTGNSGAYTPGSTDIIISIDQPKGRLVQALFEPETYVADTVTYDITAWSLPYSFGLEAYASKSSLAMQSFEKESPVSFRAPERSPYAYLLPYQDLQDGMFLAAMLRHDIKVGVLNKATTAGEISFPPGSLVILRTNNEFHPSLDKTMEELANRYQRNPVPVYSGLASSGIDLGSGNISRIAPVKAGLITGSGTSSNRSGEIWHFFEQELGYPITLLRKESVSERMLDEFDVIFMADGSYDDLLEPLKQFIKNGGRVVAMGYALELFAGTDDFKLRSLSDDSPEDSLGLSDYAMQERQYASGEIPGAIFRARMDTSHPLAYGFSGDYETLVRSSRGYMLPHGYQVALLDENPVPLNGFAGQGALSKIGGKLVVGMEQYGRGSVVYLPDNPLFRSMWDQGKLLVINALLQLN